MPVINRRTDIKYMKPLFTLASLCAILPPYDFRNGKISFGFRYKILRIFIILCLISGFIYGFVEKVNYLQPLLCNTVVVVDYLTYITYFLINLTTVLSANFHNIENLKRMLDVLVAMDKAMVPYHNDRKNKGRTYIEVEILCTFAILLSAMIFDYTIWYTATNGDLLFSPFYQNVQRTQTYIVMHVVCNFIACIRSRYRDAKILLVGAVSSKDIMILNAEIGLAKFNKPYNVKDAIKIYIGLNKMIDAINKIYGWTLLCLNINIIACLLLSFDFIIAYTSESNALRDKNGSTFIYLMIIWSVFSLILAILLSHLAHSTTLEIQSISQLSYKLLQQIPCDTINPVVLEMREDLMLLSEQMSLRGPTFSAAGFFDVDYTMVFTLLSSITSYLVVLIQFN